jgi:hypothetical protein
LQTLADIAQNVDDVVEQASDATVEALLVSTKAFENRIDDQDRVVNVFGSDMTTALDEADAALLQKLVRVFSVPTSTIPVEQPLSPNAKPA